MQATWRTVRVFISSTFRDMHAERDHLVKVVFPALRERLEKYRIHLVDIDLRWGITEEESQHDRVLDLCLQQIDECRPYFVGILGERYGWVPSSFSEEAASKYGWVQYHTGRSVTELEILYGVLNDPQMRRRAFFYFRAPAFIEELDAQHRQVFCEGPTKEELETLSPEEAEARAGDRRQKLADLKERTRQSTCPVMDGYPAKWDPQAFDRPTRTNGRLVGLEQFGRRIQDQLWEAIKAEHDLPEVPPVETLAERDPLAEEAAFHEAFMESRLRVYVGREEVQHHLVEFADSEATVPCLVTGPSGSGKSAALARFVRDYAVRRREALVIPHFVGPGATSLRQILRRLWGLEKGTGPICRNGPEDASHKLDLSPFPVGGQGASRNGVRRCGRFLGCRRSPSRRSPAAPHLASLGRSPASRHPLHRSPRPGLPTSPFPMPLEHLLVVRLPRGRAALRARSASRPRLSRKRNEGGGRGQSTPFSRKRQEGGG